MNSTSKSIRFASAVIALAFAVACNVLIAPQPNSPVASTTPVPPAATSLPLLPTASPSLAPSLESPVDALTSEQAATLRSVQKVDDYPLYTVQYRGTYEAMQIRPEQFSDNVKWSCSLFAAMGEPDSRLYGRNFDWNYSPAALVFTHPPDGYASAAMVDLAYLFEFADSRSLTELPLADRKPLLQAPLLPFDGMNDRGLVVGMAAVPGLTTPRDPAKRTIGSLRVIREMLDHASNVDEAVDVMSKYNIDMQGGPHIHYLIADATGRAALVELVREKTVVMQNETSWHLATNFLRSEAGGNGLGNCWRYDKIYQRLDESDGRLEPQGALDLLSDVSQSNTQWSVVYGMSTGSITVTMGRHYGERHTFHLERTGP